MHPTVRKGAPMIAQGLADESGSTLPDGRVSAVPEDG